MLPWLAALLALTGVALNIYKSVWCWPVWISCNLCWTVYSVPRREWAAVLMWSVFTVFDLWGWWKWSKEKEPKNAQRLREKE